MLSVSDELLYTTDDGSEVSKGWYQSAAVNSCFHGKPVNAVYCIGPVIMMKFV